MQALHKKRVLKQKAQKKKVLRAESEETQEYVCEVLAISLEEAEELALVPSALSEPRRAIYFCDNRCSSVSMPMKRRSSKRTQRRWRCVTT